MSKTKKKFSLSCNCTNCNALLYLIWGGGCSVCFVLINSVSQNHHWEGNVILSVPAQDTAAWAYRRPTTLVVVPTVIDA